MTFEEEYEQLIAERADLLFKRVNRDPAYTQPVHDGPVDRVLGAQLRDVHDLVGDLDLGTIRKILEKIMTR